MTSRPMSNIDKQAVQAVADLKAGYTLGHADVAILNELARIALVSLEAEPVAWRYRHHNGLAPSNWKVVDSEDECNLAPNYQRQALYTTPPAPVSVPEWTNEQCLEFLSIAFRHAEIKGDLELDDIRLGVKMVNGSQAAIPQGADGNSPVIPNCSCRTCRPVTFTDSRFIVCPECGNKRCPHANDHRNACTGSNETGQEGSAYPAAPQQVVK